MSKKMMKAPTKLKKAGQIFQLKIELIGTSPLVWRRILVPGGFTLDRLHSIIQLTMGWQMSHLYDFQIRKERYAEPDDYDGTPSSDLKTDLTKAAGDETSFSYNYDFGDGWQHRITIEDRVDRVEVFNYPVCTGGENACPPEDCGGLPGFDNMKRVIVDENDDEHIEMMTWLGGYFDPAGFDPNRINRDLLWAVDWRQEPNDRGLYHPVADDDDGADR